MVQSKGGYILRAAEKEDRMASPPASEMGMRQLFDPDSSTCTYLLWDKETDDAVLVDPVDTLVKRDLFVATELNLCYAINTHCHADHISGTRALKRQVKSLKSVISKASGAKSDELIQHGDEIHFGNRYITALATPGHTEGCMSFLLDDGKAILTGDALLIMGCGRCDFQGGSAETLYDSIHTQLFSLSDDTLVFPGHDYQEQRSSTIGQEKAENPRLGGGKTKEEFVQIMNDLNLPHPKMMDIAVPANLEDGAQPFFVRSLRSKIKQRWGVFG
jgi:sulfur dioxygenase